MLCYVSKNNTGVILSQRCYLSVIPHIEKIAIRTIYPNEDSPTTGPLRVVVGLCRIAYFVDAGAALGKSVCDGMVFVLLAVLASLVRIGSAMNRRAAFPVIVPLSP